MAKTLKQMLEVYKPKAADEQKFVDKHVVAKHADANGNEDDVFQGTNVKKMERKKERHGYDAGDDEKVYEEKSDNAGKFIKGFEKSDAPQFQGKSKAKRRDMAIAAYLGNKKGMKEEVVVEEEGSIPKTPREKELAAKHGDKTRITHGDVLKARGVGFKKEEVEHLEEGDVAHAQFHHYHSETAKMLKNIHGALGKHFDAVSDKKGYNGGQAHWGHVGTIKDIHRSLQDIHDRVLEQGEYAKPPKVMKEETEVASEVDVTLLSLYVNLDEDNRASMIKMLDEGRKEELLEFAATVGAE